MSFIDLILIALGVAMDASAASICKGMTMKKFELKKMLIVGSFFGFFQALMPAIGYLLGRSFGRFIVSIDHWIAFILLSIIGINMIKETINNDDESIDDNFNFKSMVMLAIATSIDALAIGVTFAFLNINIISSVLIIGIITAITSMVGCIIGKKFGDKFESKAQILGGVILILMGTKILLQHLGIINI